MQATVSQALCGKPVHARAGRQQVLVQAKATGGAQVPPAWPGRVPVPETLPTRDGPKASLGCGLAEGGAGEELAEAADTRRRPASSTA